jgi:thiamine biosynthesis lipoprotein
MIEKRFRAMGCEMLVALDGDGADPAAETALELAPIWFEHWEQSLSRFRPDSELSRVNATQGPVHVSDTFWQVLLAAREAHWRSGGLVSPTILPALEAAGYDRSFERLGAEGELSLHFAPGLDGAAGFDEVELDAANRTVTLPAHIRLDFGGVAKGWAAHKAMRKLAGWGPVLVDAGGDIAISAPPRAVDGWRIGVQDPHGGAKPLFVLEVGEGGVATSGTDYRRWTRDGLPQHHLIDPRSQRPAQSDVLSATVVGADILSAEMASKTALLLGRREGLTWLESQNNLSGLLVLHDGSLQMTENFAAIILEEVCVT